MSSDKLKKIKKIKIYMINNDLNQESLGKLLGVSQEYVSMVLTGKEKMTQKFLDLINNNKGD